MTKDFIIHDPYASLILSDHADFGNLGLATEISYFMHEISHLSRKLSASTGQWTLYQKAIRSMLHCELSLPPTLDCDKRMALMSEGCRAAACLYLLLLSNSQPTSQVSLKVMLTGLLKKTLESLDVPQHGDAAGPFVLWLLSMGGVAALGRPTRTWFAARSMDLARVLGIQTWAAVQENMEKLLWVPSVCEEPFCTFWTEVEQMGTAIGLNDHSLWDEDSLRATN